MKNLKVFATLIIVGVTLPLFFSIQAVGALTQPTNVLILQLGDEETLDDETSLLTTNINLFNENEIELSNERVDQYWDAQERYGYLNNKPLVCFPAEHFAEISTPQKINFDVMKIDILEFNSKFVHELNAQIIIIVSHGNENGLYDENSEVSWDKTNVILSSKSDSYNIISACYSSKAMQSADNIVGFESEIDYEIAAYLSLGIVFMKFGIENMENTFLNMMIDRYFLIQDDPSLIKTLGGVHPAEMMEAIVMFAIAIFVLVAGLDIVFGDMITIFSDVIGKVGVVMTAFSVLRAIFVLHDASGITVSGCLALLTVSLTICKIIVYLMYRNCIVRAAKTAAIVGCTAGPGIIVTIYKILSALSKLNTIITLFSYAFDDLQGDSDIYPVLAEKNSQVRYLVDRIF
ncbi:hypothetical protein [Candidatus Lokiarchaeum ossiferum]|uniref:hypothetical protein n=1 Tax=Candidatus Lokiarchaeum ossiferum TaxID=2951803 RepID=UPI00352FAC3D